MVPSKGHRREITVMEAAETFATEDDVVQWFEGWHWLAGEMSCLWCGSLNANRVKTGKPMPYRCRDCKRYFSFKTSTAMDLSKLPLQMWDKAIFLEFCGRCAPKYAAAGICDFGATRSLWPW